MMLQICVATVRMPAKAIRYCFERSSAANPLGCWTLPSFSGGVLFSISAPFLMRRPVDRIDSSLQFQSMQRVMAPLLQSPRYFDVTLPTRKQTQCLGVTHMQCDDFNVVVFASL